MNQLLENGNIPCDWKIFHLQDLVLEVQNGFASGKRDDDGIVQIRMNNVTSDGKLIFNSFLKVPTPKNVNFWLLKENDFLFNNTNSYDLVGKSIVFKNAPFPCTFSNHFTRIRVDDKKLSSEYLLYFFISLWHQNFFKTIALRHVGQSDVSSKQLLKLRIPLPPLAEQQRIAAVLGAADDAVARSDAAIARLERTKRALMQRLLSRGIGHARFRETEVGTVPEEWEVVELQKIAEFASGGTPSKANLEWWNGNIPWASPKDMKKTHLHDVEDHITTEASKESSTVVPAKTIFVVIRGMILARDIPVAITEVPMAFNQDIKAIFPSNKTFPEYLLLAIISRKTSLMCEISTAAHGTCRICSASIESLKIPLPPLAEQKRIAEILGTVDRRLELERERRDALARIKRGLMGELLTGRRRVKMS